MAKAKVKKDATWMGVLVNNAAPGGITQITRASKLEDAWLWVDFMNPVTGSPTLCLEWLFGTRGLLHGRYGVTKARQHAGKSALLFAFMGMAQRQRGRTILAESEDAIPQAEYIASIGCDPENLAVLQPPTIGRAFDDIEQTARMLASDPAQLKFDPGQEAVIFYGMDSISGFADKASNEAQTSGGSIMDQNGTLADHAKTASRFGRGCIARKNLRMIVWFTAQPKAKIETGFAAKMAKFAGPQETFIAEKPLGYHATWILNMQAKALREGNEYVGNMTTLRMEKNKLAPMRTLEDLPYVPNHGFDWTVCEYEWLKKHYKPGACAPMCRGTVLELSEPGGRITCPAVLGSERLPNTAEGISKLVAAVHANTPLMMEIRETQRIFGFGLPFESAWREKVVRDDKEEAARVIQTPDDAGHPYIDVTPVDADAPGA